MPKLSEAAIQKLRDVKRAILAQPSLYNQRVFCTCGPDVCNSPSCIAGWLIWLDSEKEFKKAALQSCEYDWAGSAYRLLGLSENPSWRSGNHLFGLGSYASWPDFLADPLSEAKTKKQKAKVAAEAIEHFIATDGEFGEVVA